MEYEFKVYPMQVEKHQFWVAESKALKGCVGQGETAEEAIQELAQNEKEWLITAREYGIPIPSKNIRSDKSFSGKISLRTSSYVHEEAIEMAQELGISLNQFINDALVNYISEVRQNSLASQTWNSEKILSIPASSQRKAFRVISTDLEEM